MNEENQPSWNEATATDRPEEVEEQLKAFSQVVNAMQRLTPPARSKLLQTVSTFFGIQLAAKNISSYSSTGESTRLSSDFPSSPRSPAFSEDRTISPKEFMMNKRPQSDIDRVTTLAYYMTHYRDKPQFKTFDLSKLNSEAAQIKFSNAAKAVDNATQRGMLVPTTKGMKQISAMGELYVQSLPDRVKAKEAIAHYRQRRKGRRGGRPGGSASRTLLDESGQD